MSKHNAEQMTKCKNNKISGLDFIKLYHLNIYLFYINSIVYSFRYYYYYVL